MSENDLIRRGDALALPHRLSPSLDADDGYFVSVDAIRAIPAVPTFTAADLEKLANAVWFEYHISLEEKWTFRKEHVLNAMLADLAQRVKE